MQIRPATEADVAAMVALSDARRTEYATYSPVFWRKAADGTEKQAAFFTQRQLRDDNVITLVAEDDGTIQGFVMAGIHHAPPVYDPGGPVCSIDDYMVATPALWPTLGVELLNAATAQAKERGAVLVIIVCPHLEAAKRTMLHEQGATIASEWFVKPL